MKRLLSLAVLVLFLIGCRSEQELSRGLELRQNLLNGGGCSFQAIVTADYGDKVYTFIMQCLSNENGTVSFEVLEPESISGITGNLSTQGGELTFDEEVLAFEMLADGQLSPVSAPWVLVHGLRSGYINACGTDGDEYYIQIDDSYNGNPLQLDVWITPENIPVSADILYDGKRILSLTVKNFTLL